MANSRLNYVPGIYGQNASTEIPTPPTSGVPYRNANFKEAGWLEGQKYNTLADSANWNELFFQLSSLAKLNEEYGVLPYSEFTNYPQGGYCVGLDDDDFYKALAPSGPDFGGAQPTSNAAYWEHQPTSAVKTIRDLANASDLVSVTEKAVAKALLPQILEEREFTFLNISLGWYPMDGTQLVTPNKAEVEAVIGALPDITKTEAEWQALSTAYGGVGGVPFFVLDTVGGTVRLPDLRGMYAQSKETAREVLEAGLPNILGNTGSTYNNNHGIYSSSSSGYTGALSPDTSVAYSFRMSGAQELGYGINFDASRSNTTYGKSTTVTPKTYTTIKCVYLGV